MSEKKVDKPDMLNRRNKYLVTKGILAFSIGPFILFKLESVGGCAVTATLKCCLICPPPPPHPHCVAWML